MLGVENGDTHVREATEADATAVSELFYAVYGPGYLYPEFYEEREVKRMIFDENTLVLVAEHEPSGVVTGSAGVLFQMGAYTDLVGEFGRLVVHPDWRGRGIGHRLMAERLARVGGRLHVGFVEVRVVRPHSPRISQAHGFIPVGFLPQKLIYGGNREHAGFLVKYFGDALVLRKNHPRVIPEAHHLAETALAGVGLPSDVIVDEDSAAYPRGSAFEVEELTEDMYASLLRIERGRIRHREVFGPQRLHYGLFKLAASHSKYIVARDGERIVGALGFTRDDVERHIRVFEVINTREDAIRLLFEALEERCVSQDMMAVEVDVNAHAPRMQRTLIELGYLPNAYVPAMAFHDVERLDVVKMYRLFQDVQDLSFNAPEPMMSLGRYVLSQFTTRQMLHRLAHAMESLEVCRGLEEEQTARLLGEFQAQTYAPGDKIFLQGERPREMVLVMEGRARIEIDGRAVGTVGPGESLGEVSLLVSTDHSATAIAETEMEVGLLSRGSLESLVRRRPDIGTIVYRNLARGLGEKLRRADRAVAGHRPDAP